MQVQLFRVMLVEHQRAERAGVHDLLHHTLVRAIFLEPVLVEMHHVVHASARLADHAAQRNILDAAAEAAGGMPLDVRKINQEAGVLDHAGHLPGFHVLVFPLVQVEITVIGSACRVDGAAQHLLGVTAALAGFHIPGHVRHKGLTAAIFDGLYHLAHEHGVDHRVADVVAQVQLETHRLALHPVAQVQLFEDQVKLGR